MVGLVTVIPQSGQNVVSGSTPRVSELVDWRDRRTLLALACDGSVRVICGPSISFLVRGIPDYWIPLRQHFGGRFVFELILHLTVYRSSCGRT